MLKILMSGCSGKMGKMVTEAVDDFPNIEICAGFDSKSNTNLPYKVYNDLSLCAENVDVIIDFSRPSALKSLLDFSKKNKVPVVLCTTGYSAEELFLIKEASKTTAIFHSANMSLGINIVKNILSNISKFLYEDFDIEIIEKHHNQKIDAPSGTALLLGDTIKESIPVETVYNHGRVGNCKRQKKEIGMHAVRGGNIVGEHDVIFAGGGEVIEIKHSALSRKVFAVGAIKAASFVAGKGPGLYNMDNMLS